MSSKTLHSEATFTNRSNRWNWISIICPFVGLLVGYLVMTSTPYGGGDSWGWGRLVLSAFVVAGFFIVGVVTGIGAIARGEKSFLLSLIGILLNGAPAFVVIKLLTTH